MREKPQRGTVGAVAAEYANHGGEAGGGAKALLGDRGFVRPQESADGTDQAVGLPVTQGGIILLGHFSLWDS